MLELDPEGSAYCVLSAQDAVEIAGIFTGEARAIWENSAKQNTDPARVDGDITKSCKLWTATGVLQTQQWGQSRQLASLPMRYGEAQRFGRLPRLTPLPPRD